MYQQGGEKRPPWLNQQIILSLLERPLKSPSTQVLLTWLVQSKYWSSPLKAFYPELEVKKKNH